MSVPLTMRIDAALKSSLEAEARRADMSTSQLAQQAIRAHLDARTAERAAIAAALEEADAGRFVSHEAVQDWIESWDSDAEIPPPTA